MLNNKDVVKQLLTGLLIALPAWHLDVPIIKVTAAIYTLLGLVLALIMSRTDWRDEHRDRVSKSIRKVYR